MFAVVQLEDDDSLAEDKRGTVNGARPSQGALSAFSTELVRM